MSDNKPKVKRAKGSERTPLSDKASLFVDIPKGIWEDQDWTPGKFRAQVRGAIRQIFFRWPGRKSILDKRRVEIPQTKKDGTPSSKPAVFYKCDGCGALCKPMKNAAGHPRAWVDHIDPVVPIDDPYPSWDKYIHALWCNLDNFQVLCDNCHSVKSAAENKERRKHRVSVW